VSVFATIFTAATSDPGSRTTCTANSAMSDLFDTQNEVSMLSNVDDDGKEVGPWHFSLREIDLTHYDTSLPTESAAHASHYHRRNRQVKLLVRI